MTNVKVATFIRNMGLFILLTIGAVASGCSDDWYEEDEQATAAGSMGPEGPQGPTGPTGRAGNDGMSPLVHTARFESGDFPDLCEEGGITIVNFYDIDDVEGLSTGDTIIGESYLCDGETGEPGSSCTVYSPRQGVYTQVCGDGSSVSWRDGEIGPMGPQGPAGQNGSNGTNGQCSVVDNGDGTATMSCTDGTEVTWAIDRTTEEPECSVDTDCPGSVTYECIGTDGNASVTTPICLDGGTCGFADDGYTFRADCVVQPSCDDEDGDGVCDVDDQCIDVPEDIDGSEDYDGCPEYNVEIECLRGVVSEAQVFYKSASDIGEYTDHHERTYSRSDLEDGFKVKCREPLDDGSGWYGDAGSPAMIENTRVWVEGVEMPNGEENYVSVPGRTNSEGNLVVLASSLPPLF